jgi:hypothetical protein
MGAARSQPPRRAAEHRAAHAQGKAVARLNALKHGLTASTIAVPGEDATEYERVHNDLVATLHPEGALEE